MLEQSTQIHDTASRTCLPGNRDRNYWISFAFVCSTLLSNRAGSRSLFTFHLRSKLMVLATLVWAFSNANAQATLGVLIGEVHDSGGKAVVNAKVTTTNLANGNTRSTRTNKKGEYSLLLPPGNYRITSSKEGFVDVTITLSVQLNQKNVVEYPPDIEMRLVTLTGEVVDHSGSALPNARVAVINKSNGHTKANETDEYGNYSISDLPWENYILIAPVTEGAQEIIEAINVGIKTENVVALPITLVQAPNQSQSSSQSNVRVGRPKLVNTLDATRSANLTARQITSLPLGGATNMRTFDELAMLVPGVAPPPYTPGVRGPGVGFGVGTAGEFSVNGMRARSNNFAVDGSDNNDPDVGVRRQGFVALVPQSLESINDFSISTLLWDAELGRNFGSQVNAVSKYGGHEFHGQAYAFFTDSRLNARNFFDYTGGVSGGKDPFTRTQSGFVIGGPITHRNTQFFSSFEHIDVNASTERHFSTPRMDERRFLNQPNFGVLDPLRENNRSVFFATTLGTAPLGRNVLAFYPEPNNAGGPYGQNTYTEVLPAAGSGDVFSFRVTRQFAEGMVLNTRYNFTDDDRVVPSINQAIRSTIRAETRTQNLSLIFDTALPSGFFNQARFSYGRTRSNFSERLDDPFIFANRSIETVSGIPRPVPSQTGPLGEVTVQPFSPVGVEGSTFPQNRVDNTFQYADSMFITLSDHSIKFGGDIHRIQLNTRQERNYRPQAVYGNALLNFGSIDLGALGNIPFTPSPGSGQQLVSGLQLATIGLPSSIFQTIASGTPDPTIGLRFIDYGFFVNDNWRVGRNFSLDYGVRYEYTSVPHEVNGRIESALRLNNLPSSGGSPADTPERTAAFNEAINAYREVLGGRARIYEPDPNNFGAHVGFAWAPRSKGKIFNVNTAVRAGYGIYYDTILGAVVSQSRNVFPNEIPLNVDPTFGGFDVFDLRNPSFMRVEDGRFGRINPIPLIATGSLNQFGGSPEDFVALIGDLFVKNRRGGGLAFTLPAKNLRTPYAQQWHLTLERQISDDYLMSAAYVGTKGTKLTRLTTPNLGPNVTTLIPVSTGFTTPDNPNPRPLDLIGLPPFLVIPKDAESIRRERPVPALGPYRIFENSASSNYHALQIEARKRYSHGYTFTVAYTWSHAIDDVSDIFPLGGAPVLSQNSSNYRLERANASFDVRHRLATSLVWDLPFYLGSTGTKAQWLGGWQIASIFQANTGQPFTLNVPVDANFDGNLTDGPSTTEGIVFVHGHGPSQIALESDGDVTNFFAFGQDGFVGRNTLRGDSFINLDLSLSKTFSFSGEKNLIFRAESFNLLNRANFGLPIRAIGAPGFGSAVDTVNPARIIQFALRYSF